MTTRSVVVVFLDGVGLGATDHQVNPFMHVTLRSVQDLLGIPYLTREAIGTITQQAALLGLDARMGVSGLPQSGTGQVTILTGHNAPILLGEHLGPYPSQRLRRLLEQHNMFKTLLQAGFPVAYANAYPNRFLDRVRRGTGRLSANTTAARMAGLKLRNVEDLRRGRAISALLDNEFWPEPNVRLPTVSPYQAGAQFANLAQDHALTFFEFWYTDLLGHRMEREESIEILNRLDEFFAGVIANLDFEQSLLVVVSDHGNFEDWTIKKHTLNPSLTILIGQNVKRFVPRLKDLSDIKAMVLSYLWEDSNTFPV